MESNKLWINQVNQSTKILKRPQTKYDESGIKINKCRA